MPATDRLHGAARNALIHGGWTITHDPLTLQFEGATLHIDLGAEKLIAAELNGRKIAVEVKGLSGPSLIADLQQTLGQMEIYNDVLAAMEPDRELYLALPVAAISLLQKNGVGRLILKNRLTHIVVFDPKSERITAWTP